MNNKNETSNKPLSEALKMADVSGSYVVEKQNKDKTIKYEPFTSPAHL